MPPPAGPTTAGPGAARGGTIQQKKIANMGSRVAKRQTPRLVLHAQSDETFWLREEGTHVPIRPNGLYNFVKVEPKGPIHLSKVDGHPALADGQSVEYAGEMTFDDGRMRFWSNASGNYQPRVDLHDQAGLPDDKFLSYEDVLRGKGHIRPTARGCLPTPAEQHAAAVAATRSVGTMGAPPGGAAGSAPKPPSGPAKRR